LESEVTSEPGPALSICILSWNTSDLLHACLQSIFEDPQSREWEVVVVDNNSSDSSPAMVAAGFPQVRLAVNSSNLGFATGNNRAMEIARGDNLLLLNSDTRVEPGSLGRLADFLAANPDVGAVGPKLLSADGSVQLSCGIRPSLLSEFVNKMLLHNLFPFYKLGRWHHRETRDVDWVMGACLLVRRRVVEEVGGLDSAIFMYHEDLDWCLRIRDCGWRIAYFPYSCIHHLRGASTRQNLRNMLVVSQRSHYFLFAKHFGKGHVLVLRFLTLIEMTLRSMVWLPYSIVSSQRRGEGHQRLLAYRDIFWKSLFDRAYWRPTGLDAQAY
jgi:GT2 family glycosyltransferase